MDWFCPQAGSGERPLAVSNVQTHGWSGGCRRLWHAQHKVTHLYHLQTSVHICEEGTEKMEMLMMEEDSDVFAFRE